jgi:hypothetical protein
MWAATLQNALSVSNMQAKFKVPNARLVWDDKTQQDKTMYLRHNIEARSRIIVTVEKQ